MRHRLTGLQGSILNTTPVPRERPARSLREPGTLIVGLVAALSLAFAIIGLIL